MMLNAWAAFAAGVACLLFLPELPDPAWPALAALTLAVLSLRYRYVRVPACLLLGLAWGSWRADHYLADRLPAEAEGLVVGVEVRVCGLPEPSPHQRLRLRVEPLRDRTGRQPWPSGRYWELNAPQRDFRPGDVWRMSINLRRPVGSVSPGAFDAEEWWMSEGVTATGIVKEAERLTVGGRGIDAFRLQIRERFLPIIADKPQAAVALALLTGDRGLVTDGQEALYRDSGIMHLMAISGPHVLLFALGVVWVVRRLLGFKPSGFRSLPFHRLRWPLLLVSATAYALLAGASLPTMRTLVMLAVCALSGMAGRLADRWGVLWRAMAVVLLWQPLSVHAAGFWLSFGAVAILMLSGTGTGNGLKGFTRLQFTLFLALLPLSLLFFGQISLASPLANLVAVPLVGWVIAPLDLMGLLLGTMWDHAGMACWYWAACLLELLDRWLILMVSGPLDVWRWQPSVWVLACLSLAILALLSPRRLLPRETALLFILPGVLNREPLHEGALRMSVLDVGQGLAVVLQTRRHSLLYDTGPTPMAGERVVLPYLTGAGIRKIETLVLSHNDSDHTGGADSLMRALPVDRILYSALPEGYRPESLTRQAFCRAGEGWREDAVDFRFLSPGPDLAGAADNNRSCVLRISGAGFSVLLTGDIEKETEAALLGEGSLEPVDVLVLPHHGSKTSSTAGFIAAMHPRRGIISAGYRNRFGHPNPVVVGRYRDAGVALDSTIAGGTLVYEWAPGRPMRWHRERDRRHYWRISP